MSSVPVVIAVFTWFPTFVLGSVHFTVGSHPG